MAKQVASLFGVLSLDDKDFIRGLGIAKSGILDLENDTKSMGNGLADGMKRVGDKLMEIGGQLSTLGSAITTITGPLVGFGQEAVSAATDFDESMKNIQAAAGYTSDEMIAVRDQVFEIGEASRYGPKEAALAFYEIAGGVSDASVRMDIFESSVKAAQAGNTDLTDTTKALIGIMNGYGFSADEAGFASDVLTRIVGTGVGSMGEFGAAIAKAAKFAPDLDVSLDDLGSAMAYLTTKNIPASEAATILQSTMTSLLNPTKDMSKAIEDLGYESGSALIKGEGLVGAYLGIKEVSGFEGVITNTEALAGAATLATEEFIKFDNNFKGSTITTWNGQTGSAAAMVEFQENIKGATDAAESVQMDSAAAQFDLLDSKLESLNVMAGTTLLESLKTLASTGLIPIIDSVMDWVSANPQAAATLMMLVFAVAAFGVALTVAGTAVSAIGAAITVLSGPIGLAILAVALLGAAYMSNFGGIKDFIDGTVAPIISDFIETLKTIWTTVQPGLQQLADFFVQGPMQAMMNIIRIILKIVGGVIDVLGGIWASVKPGVEQFAKGIQDVLAPVVKFIAGIANAISEVLAALGSEQIRAAGGAPTVGNASAYLASVKGGGRAAGGPVMGGVPYTVGEQGREVFVPSTSGTIIPNGQAEGMMGGVQIGTVVIQANDAAGGRAAAEGFDTRLKELRAARG